MVRSVLTYLLLISVALQPFSREVTIMSFELNREYIIKNLCENRDRPQLHCDGKCFLAKKLAAQQKQQDKETADRIHNLPLLQWFYADPTGFTFAGLAPADADDHAANWTYLMARYAAPRHGLFQPPRC